MRRGHQRMWWAVPCASRKALRTDSRKDIEEILKTKLATIREEPEVVSDENRSLTSHLRVAKKGKKISSKVKMGRCVMPYLLFMNGVSPKGHLAVLA